MNVMKNNIHDSSPDLFNIKMDKVHSWGSSLFKFSILILTIFILSTNDLLGQTRGMIIQPASGTVLDTDGDGYISTDEFGFSGDSDDTDEFENASEWSRFPTVGVGEKLSDVRSGPQEGFTDFSVDPAGYATYLRLDGTNIIFRFRLADFRPNAKGYTVLIDTDGAIGAGDAIGDNPGFELAILLRSKHEVSIIEFDGSSACGTTKNTYSLSSNHQKSISGIQSGGDNDFFYDFYVPLADLYAAGGINSSTGLRFAATTNTSNTCTFQGSVSDIGGMDDSSNACLSCALQEIVEVQTPASTSDINSSGLPTGCPSLSSEIQSGTPTVSGVAALGAAIVINADGSQVGSTTASSTDGSYSVTLSAVTAGQVITATAQISGLTISSSDCNTVTVVDACTTGRLTISTFDVGGQKVITGTTDAGLSGLPIIEVYDFTNGTLASSIAGTLVYTMSDGTYVLTASSNFIQCQSAAVRLREDANSCWSDYSYLCVRSTGGCTRADETSATITSPNMSATQVLGTSPNITGTVHLYTYDGLDANSSPLITGYIGSGAATASGWTVNLTAGTTVADYGCGGLSAVFYESGNCMSLPITGTVSGSVASDAPTVEGTYCSPVETIYGASGEEEGTIIEVFVGSSIGTTTVNEYGSWNLSGLNLTSGTITATAQNSGNCETVSSASSGTTISTTPSAPSITWPATVTEGATSVATGGSGTLILYVDGAPMTDNSDNIFTTTNGTFTGLSANVNDAHYLYAGALLAVVLDGTCDSPESNVKEVSCITPDTELNISPLLSTVSSGSTVDVTVSSAEAYTIYQLYNEDLVANSGASALGLGTNLTLTSLALTADATLQTKSYRVYPNSCTSSLTKKTVVTIGVVSVPTVTTTAASSVATTSATLAGNVTSDGGSAVTERGIVYSVTSTNGDPLISGTGVTKDTNGTGTGVFTESIGSLSPGTSYSYKAYAINGEGTTYGSVETFTTLKLDQTITFGGLGTKTYGDVDFTLGGTASSTLTVTYVSSDPTIASISGTTVTIHKAGSVIITASQSGNGTYNAAVDVPQTLIIDKIALTVTVSADDKVYDGATTATVGTASLVGIINSEVVSIDASPSVWDFDNANVGTSKSVTATTGSYTLTGAGSGNYSITQPTGLTSDITAIALTVTVSADDKVYDGATTATVGTASLVGIINSEVVSIDASPSVWDFDNANVGTNKSVTATTGSYTLTGTGSGNYSITQPTGLTSDITAIALTVTVSADDKVYDGATTATVGTASLVGIINS
ncbi:MAG: YDG domain-containing protein, partial [Reichenbachiella sp.]